MKNKELIHAKEEVRIDAPVVIIQGEVNKKCPEDAGKYIVEWNVRPWVNVWNRIWNVLTNPIVYILVGKWRI